MKPTKGALRLKDVRVAYGGNVVVSSLSLDIKPGELVTVLGPSGCGKTSLLLALAGLLPLVNGQIVLDGKRTVRSSPDRAMVFQDLDQLLPWKTVKRNVEFGARHGMAESKSRDERARMAEQLLAMVGLSHVEDHYPVQLSGGMRQRVAIARSLAAEPAMLLMDEPFSALDAQTREQLQQDLLSIWLTTSKTIVFITHSIEEAALLGTRLIVMGKSGTLLTDFQNPAGPHQAFPLDHPARSEVRARLRDALDASRRQFDPGERQGDAQRATSPATRQAASVGGGSNG